MMAIINYVVNREGGGGDTDSLLMSSSCFSSDCQTGRAWRLSTPAPPSPTSPPSSPAGPGTRSRPLDSAVGTSSSTSPVSFSRLSHVLTGSQHVAKALLLHPQPLVGASCLSLCLYLRRVGSMHAKILCREISDCCLCCNLFKT